MSRRARGPCEEEAIEEEVREGRTTMRSDRGGLHEEEAHGDEAHEEMLIAEEAHEGRIMSRRARLPQEEEAIEEKAREGRTKRSDRRGGAR